MQDYFLLRLSMLRLLKTIITYDVTHLTKEEYLVDEKSPGRTQSSIKCIGLQGHKECGPAFYLLS